MWTEALTVYVAKWALETVDDIQIKSILIHNNTYLYCIYMT